MDLYLQFGFGMMGHCEHLIDNWGGGTVILSPRDQELDQMSSFVSRLSRRNGEVILDPQFYMPRANHIRLTRHSYWPENFSTAMFRRSEIRRMLTILKEEYNDVFRTPFFILPGGKSNEINEDWYNYHSLIINEAINLKVHDDLYATLCLGNEAMLSEDAIHNVLEYVDEWDVTGCYIVAEPPSNNYLVDNPNWLANLLDLSAGLKLQGKKVVVGYSNHQMLTLALTKVSAIASGNWLNVRSFNANRFNNPEGDGGRRSKWYYCPQALSEYQLPFLDTAQRMAILDRMRTDNIFNSPYANILFSGAQPTTVNFGERDSFRHYLQCLKVQALGSVRDTYMNTLSSLRLQLETSDQLTSFFISNGVRGKDRDFSNCVDSSLSSVDVFHRLRGMILNHRWDSL
jgi:hypothetical protein